MKISVVVGNPKQQSRTLDVASALAHAVAASTGAQRDRTIDLTVFASQMFSAEDPDLTELTQAVARTDLLVVASPTYKASFTGLLKAFLDRFTHQALAGVACIPVMTGASMAHAMAPDTQLRPVLVDLGSSVPTTAFYLDISQLAQLSALIDQWMELNAQPLTLWRTSTTAAR